MAKTKKVAALIVGAIIALGDNKVRFDNVEGVRILPPNGDGETGVLLAGMSGISYSHYFSSDKTDEAERIADSKEQAEAFAQAVADKIEELYKD